MSNLYSLFGGNSSLWLNNDRGDWLLNTIQNNSNILPTSLENNTEHVFEVPCPLCNESIHIMNIPIHISEAHPITYQFWLYTMMPSAYTQFIQQNNEDENQDENNESNDTMMDYFSQLIRSIDTDTDSMSYDQLVTLCDSIGYHHVGYTNIEKEALCEPCSHDVLENFPMCAICLTEFSEMDIPSQTSITRLKKCQHVFCEACIYQWLDTHKKCPVCNQIQDD
jgi:hypothetical protein